MRSQKIEINASLTDVYVYKASADVYVYDEEANIIPTLRIIYFNPDKMTETEATNLLISSMIEQKNLTQARLNSETTALRRLLAKGKDNE